MLHKSRDGDKCKTVGRFIVTLESKKQPDGCLSCLYQKFESTQTLNSQYMHQIHQKYIVNHICFSNYNRISLYTILLKSLGFPSMLPLIANVRLSGFPTLEASPSDWVNQGDVTFRFQIGSTKVTSPSDSR